LSILGKKIKEEAYVNKGDFAVVFVQVKVFSVKLISRPKSMLRTQWLMGFHHSGRGESLKKGMNNIRINLSKRIKANFT